MATFLRLVKPGEQPLVIIGTFSFLHRRCACRGVKDHLVSLQHQILELYEDQVKIILGAIEPLLDFFLRLYGISLVIP